MTTTARPMTRRFAVIAALAVTGAACTLGEPTAPSATAPPPQPAPPPTEAARTVPPVPTNDPLPLAAAAPLAGGPTLFVTHHRLDGNRYAGGRGSLPGVAPVDIPVAGPPKWVVGALVGGEAVWVVALEAGTLEAWTVRGGRALSVELDLATLPPGTPPAVLVTERGEVGVVAPAAGESPLTSPIVLPSGWRAAVRDDGTLAMTAAGEVLEVDAELLADARLVSDGSGRVMALARPTDRYRHGVLGDELEAARVVIVDPTVEGTVSSFDIGPPEVVEGIAPIWADLGGPEGPDVILTLSDERGGARVATYSAEGEELAAGPPIGRGNRWRHQISVAPFGPGGETELAVVRTPHIGGVVEFYRWEGDELVIVATAPGFTSHRLGSRNLDLALAADADGDGRVEVVVPTQDRTALGAIARTADGAEVAWTVPLGGTVATNLAAVELPGGRLALAAGRDDGVLRVWPAAAG